MKTVYSKRGIVCASEPLAAEAGIEMLEEGGNAVDAALAAAACLTVTEPVNCGIGGDAFAQIYYKGKMYGLNSSGPAAAAADAEEISKRYGGTIPSYGWVPVTVPGIPAAWRSLKRRFGRMTFREIFRPAIKYAEEGYLLTPVIAELWSREYDKYMYLMKNLQREGRTYGWLNEWFRVFAPKGRAPREGERFRNPDIAKTLREFMQNDCESFYTGEIAFHIDDYSERSGGHLTFDDLKSFEPEWVTPITSDYRGFTVSELPPNGQGIVVLEALKILDLAETDDMSAEKVMHVRIEAMKLAFADALEYLADPEYMDRKPEDFLSDRYIKSRADLISEQALEPAPGDPGSGDTVYLCAADGEGNMVSYIQSNYQGFGSGIVIPGTGIALHNRGTCFSLDVLSPNYIAPGKRPYHTIIPGFLLRNGSPVGPVGVMGAYMQPQGQLQILTDMIDMGMDPQSALCAPRWQWTGGKNIEVEPDFPEDLAAALAARGHDITRARDCLSFGRGQIIIKTSDGGLEGASEPRADGKAAVL